MRSNKIESFLGFTCFGESHGKALGVVIEDVLPNVEFPLQEIQNALDKRRPGKSLSESSRSEKDLIQIISGVYEGKTTGMPICLLVYNQDAKSEDYQALKEIFRPGHADFSWYKKFKILDWRGGGRASGRETISRVIAGAFLEKFIQPCLIDIFPVSIGNIVAKNIVSDFVNKNHLSWPDENNFDQALQLLESTKKEGDSLGAVLKCRISNLPAGLGDPVFEKLEANLAKAVLSVGGVKGIEFGEGFSLAFKNCSNTNDQMRDGLFLSNNMGGFLGGVSNGSELIFYLALKPIPSINIPQQTCDIHNQNKIISIAGRHDVCLVPRIIPVIRAMIQITLADAVAHQNLIMQNPPDLISLRESIDKIDEDILLALLRRSQISKQIGLLKSQQNLPILNSERETQLLSDLSEKAEFFGLDPEYIKKLWHLIIENSRKLQ